MFLFPKRKGYFIVRDEFKALALGRAEDCFSGDLLPPRARLIVLHDEVRTLTLDARTRIRARRALGDSTSMPHSHLDRRRSVNERVELAQRNLLEILKHMDREEREILNPDVLRDDAYSVAMDTE